MVFVSYLVVSEYLSLGLEFCFYPILSPFRSYPILSYLGEDPIHPAPIFIFIITCIHIPYPSIVLFTASGLLLRLAEPAAELAFDFIGLQYQGPSETSGLRLSHDGPLLPSHSHLNIFTMHAV